MDYLNIFSTLAKFSLGISFITGIHELGHMLLAKLFRMNVEQYMIGLPPKLFSFTLGKTEYGLGSLPLGGFVKIAGMADEHINSDQRKKTLQKGDFDSKPKLQQLIVILGGILFNLLSALIIYTFLIYLTGTPYISQQEINKHGIAPTALGISLGLEPGDKIIKKNHQTIQYFDELAHNLSNTLSYTVIRKDKQLIITIPPLAIKAIKDGKRLMDPLIPFTINKILPNSQADVIGLVAGDTIVAINNLPTPYYQDLNHLLNTHRNQTVQLTYQHNRTQHTQEIFVNNKGTIGIQILPTIKESRHMYNSVIAASYAALQKITNLFMLQAKGIKMILTGQHNFSSSVGGPVRIASLFQHIHDTYTFWETIAFISILVAFMNALPIPALDGGHAIIICYEIVSRKKLNYKTRLNLEKIGLFFLGALMLFALYNDLYKLF